MRTTRVPSTRLVVDSHVHLWDTRASSRFPPRPDFPIPEDLPGDAETLVTSMRSASVDVAVVVQPINYGFDHGFVLDALSSEWARRNGSMSEPRLIGMALANTQDGPEKAREEVRARLVTDGFRGVRINPALVPGNRLDGETVQAVLDTIRSSGRKAPASLFVKPEHFDEVRNLAATFPDVNLLIDHFGFCRPIGDDVHFSRLKEIASTFPNVYVKVSALFGCSNREYPYHDIHPWMRALCDDIGAERLLWGSDFPFVTRECGYGPAKAISEELCSKSVISTEEGSWIFGGTACEVFGIES